MPTPSTAADLTPDTPTPVLTGDGDTIDLRDGPGASPRSKPADTAGDVANGEPELRAVRPYLSTRVAVRAFDLVVAVTTLVVLAPLLLILALVVKIDSPGPTFYGSPRIGQNGRIFTAWKFRSMHRDADEQLRAVLASDPDARREYRTFHKLKNDPRLTPAGRIMRRTSLDELPQLVNIVRGDMSVVGPRPNLVSEASLFGEALAVVLQVRPGLTGLWQVSGRNRLSVNQRVSLDLTYATTRTVAGDLRICGRTFLQLWQPGRHGGY